MMSNTPDILQTTEKQGIYCPVCGSETEVRRTRPQANQRIQRGRRCVNQDCLHTFTTREVPDGSSAIDPPKAISVLELKAASLSFLEWVQKLGITDSATQPDAGKLHAGEQTNAN